MVYVTLYSLAVVILISFAPSSAFVLGTWTFKIPFSREAVSLEVSTFFGSLIEREKYP